MQLAEIRETFSFFDSWEDKYRFVIDLGRDLAQLNTEDRIDANLIRGCQSQVWLVASYDKNTDTLSMQIDSDAHIVRGLIAIVLTAYNNTTPAEILVFDIEKLFDDLELLQHLSPTRGNGLRAMVARVRAIAVELSE
jgi:cysteine desulfuration protein SufE